MRTPKELVLAWPVVLVFGASTVCLWSQSESPDKTKPKGQIIVQGAIVPEMVAPDDPEVFAEMQMDFSLRGVKEHPFSARVIVQTDRRLDNGNLIHRTTEGKVFRDAQGRVRYEKQLPAELPVDGTGDRPVTVSISDPPGGVHYFMMPARKIAFKMRVPPPFQLSSPEDRSFAATLLHSGSQSEPLGYQMLEGLQAKGTLVKITTPVGAVGNTYPIEVETEQWYSADLKAILMVKRKDPRNGEVTFKLVDIAREEPPASLFGVPPDYEVHEGGMEPTQRKEEPHNR